MIGHDSLLRDLFILLASAAVVAEDDYASNTMFTTTVHVNQVYGLWLWFIWFQIGIEIAVLPFYRAQYE